MEKLNQRLIDIIKKGESINVEFKYAFNTLPKSLFETICAMLNREGGHIFLGVKDDRTIVGVDRNSVDKMEKEFANLCNNPSKINPTVYLNMQPYE